MNLPHNVEKIILMLTASACVIIPILDFIGALENIQWLYQRIPMMTMLALGLIALYLIVSFIRIEGLSKNRTDEILKNIKSNELDERIINEIKGIWEIREKDIQTIFEQLKLNSRNQDVKNLVTLLNEMFLKITSGNFFGTKIHRPMDFTLTAINFKGDFIYHPAPNIISTRATNKFPYNEVMKERNGSVVWINYGMSEQAGKFTDDRLKYRYRRFTKLYFREFTDLSAIVVLESHINLVHEFPQINDWGQ